MVDVGQPLFPPQVLTGLWTADDRRLGLGCEDQTVQIYGIVEFLALVIRWPLLSLLYIRWVFYTSQAKKIAQIMVHRLSCFMTKRTQTCHVEGNLEILRKSTTSFLSCSWRPSSKQPQCLSPESSYFFNLSIHAAPLLVGAGVGLRCFFVEFPKPHAGSTFSLEQWKNLGCLGCRIIYTTPFLWGDEIAIIWEYRPI